MTLYIVLDENGKKHPVESNAPGAAIAQIPSGESVRAATHRELVDFYNMEKITPGEETQERENKK